MTVSRKVVRSIILMAGLVVLLIIVSNIWVILATRSHVYNSVDSLPHNRVGLVLGTTSKLKTGEQNPLFYMTLQNNLFLYKGH